MARTFRNKETEQLKAFLQILYGFDDSVEIIGIKRNRQLNFEWDYMGSGGVNLQGAAATYTISFKYRGDAFQVVLPLERLRSLMMKQNNLKQLKNGK